MKHGFSTYLIFVMFGLIGFSCSQDENNIASVEERKAAATAELQAELTSPANGWRLNYKPTPDAGTFLIFMNFYENGTVRVQSDVADNDGEFLDDTLTYRIDHDLATELILETYGVFHYLFELNQNSFGAEYEFIYKGKTGDNLLFASKTDVSGEISYLTFSPAGSADVELISTEIIEQLNKGGFRQGELAGIGANLTYQIYLPNDNVSIFASFDLGNRRAKVHGAAVGYTFDEVANASQSVEIQSLRDIAFIDEEISFDDPVDFSLAGKNYSLSNIAPSNFQELDTSYCSGQNDIYALFDASYEGIGNGEMKSTVYTNFSPFYAETSAIYDISAPFLFDNNDSSLIDVIDASFENVFSFLMIYQSSFRGHPEEFTGMGFVGLDEKSRLQFYLREMEIINQNGNYLEFQLTDGTFINVADSLAQRDALFALTDEIFAGGVVYGSEVLSFEDLYEVYNPCNDYHFFLFK